MELSIIIPAYNEEHRIGATLQSVIDYIVIQKINAEIIIVDDGSNDRTSFVCKSFQKDAPYIQIYHQEKNEGKGSAVKRGILLSSGKYVLFMDADSSTPITELPKLLKWVEQYDIVIGSRHLNKNITGILAPWYRRMITSLGRLVVRQLFNLPIKDTQCGFKIFKKEPVYKLAKLQTTSGFGFDIELLVRARNLKYSIKEVSVYWSHSKQGRYKPFRDSFKTFLEILALKKRLSQEL